MRKPLFFSLLAGIALASSFATSPAEAEGVKLNKGRFVLVINPQTLDGKAIRAMKHPFWSIGAGYRNAAGGFVFGGKKAPHVTGSISGTGFKGRDDHGLTLEGKLSSNEKVAALSGKFTLTVGKGVVGGSFAVVPMSSCGG